MITLDVETKSKADLPLVGAWNYSLHPSTDVICLSYQIDAFGWNDQINSWIPDEDMPSLLFQAIEHGMEVEAFNVAFEEAIWYNVLMPKYGFVAIKPHMWRDCMAKATFKALPAGLDRLSKALGGKGKNPEGSRLISKYSKLNLKTATQFITSNDLIKFRDYCDDDVAEEGGISEFLGDMPDREVEIFQLNREINRRGIFFDEAGIRAASAIVDQRAAELTEEFQELVGLNPTQSVAIKKWFHDQGVHVPDTGKDTLLAALGDPEYVEPVEVMPGIWGVEPIDIPDNVRKAMQIKTEVGKASTRKLDAMLRHRGPDGRARDQTRYHGAATGRETGVGIQVLNLVRSWEHIDPQELVDAIMTRDMEWVSMLYGDPMEAVSKASRHWIMAAPGNKIMAGDYTSIEAIVLACLAGEDWKIEAFHNKEPIYERMGEKIHNLPRGTVTKKTHPNERQDGKTGELAFGFQGGLNAWYNFDKSGRHTPERIIEICKAWRGENPAIVNLWGEYDDCMKYALSHPGSSPSYRGVSFQVEDVWLTITLLNGKKLYYFRPEFRMQMPGWHQPETKSDCRNGTCDCKPKPVITYMAQKLGKWMRVSTYGGKITENVVQATAREILETAKLGMRGTFDIILSVYDEIVVELPCKSDMIKIFNKMLLVREDWYADWPISADAWEGIRYRK